MQFYDPTDPAVLWLNIMNFALGLVCLVCIGIIAVAVAREIAMRLRMRARLTGPVETPAADDHGFFAPDLGYTMADGGEPVKKERPVTGNRPK
jgi:hypothetical protein